MTASEDEINVLMGYVLVKDMMRHAAEGGYARTGTDKIQVFFNGFGQGKYSLGTSEYQLAAYFHLLE